MEKVIYHVTDEARYKSGLRNRRTFWSFENIDDLKVVFGERREGDSLF
jgi:hypothetical protein